MNKAFEFFFKHIIVIIIFAIIYLILGNDHFYGPKDEKIGFIDSVYFSTATQTTVGYNDFTPKTSLAKIIVILQLFTLFFITSSSIFGFSLEKLI